MRRGCLPQNTNPISPTHKSTLGIIQIKTKANQVTVINQNILICTVSMSDFLRRPKGRRSNIALDLQFMQIFTNQKYS